MEYTGLEDAFPRRQYPTKTNAQQNAFTFIQGEEGTIVLELPTGSGKTAIGYTFLTALAWQGKRDLFYTAPNKTLVEQVHTLHPDVAVAYGRNEHPCLYYPDEDLKADEIPCSMLADCAHRVDQETGETFAAGAIPCPYLQQKYEAKHTQGIVVCTFAFFLFTVLFSKEFEPEGVVVDEVQGLADAIRSVLSTEMTDWKLAQGIDALNALQSEEVHPLGEFLRLMQGFIKSRAMDHEELLEENEIKQLYDSLGKVNADHLDADARRAIREGELDVFEDRQVLKQLEDISRSVRRFRHAMRYAMTGATMRGYPLSFVIAYGKTEMGEREKVQYRLTVRDYYVVPLLKKILPEALLAMSATVGDPEVLAFETGIQGAYHAIPSSFPAKNARVYMPANTANLAAKNTGSKRAKTRMIRMIARTAKRFADQGHRSVVIVVSNDERYKFLELAKEEGLNTISYGNGLAPRECAKRFRDGEADCLVGTLAHYGEGVDLPKGIAPVIFVLRPGYPNPLDPQSKFEERRFGSRRWQLWNWRVMVELLQVRGRNIRSETDVGVTFLISQQFRRFAFGTLPDWLRPAYRGQLTFEQCVEDAEKLLNT